MIINCATNFNYAYIHHNDTKLNKVSTENLSAVSFQKMMQPSTKQYLSFLGGYSLNLAETLANLNDEAFPPDIKAMAEEILADGNPEDKTLISVHKAKYDKIKEMKSLNEVREAFPEFRNVLSEYDVDYKKNSFIYDVKMGNLEKFNPDIDVALQLLKLYWADCCSITKMKQYTGRNAKNVLEKFNIPLFSNQYARVLQLSDKKYNKQNKDTHSAAMKQAWKEKQTEPIIHILSDETKRKISHSVKAYYAKHPGLGAEKNAKMLEAKKLKSRV